MSAHSNSKDFHGLYADRPEARLCGEDAVYVVSKESPEYPNTVWKVINGLWFRVDQPDPAFSGPNKSVFGVPSEVIEPEPTGRKDDSGKLQYSLVDPYALAWLVGVLTHGAIRYAPENWRMVENANVRYYEALERHLQAWRTGESDDPDSGMPHLAHAMCDVMFLLALGAPRDMNEIVKRTREAIRRAREKT